VHHGVGLCFLAEEAKKKPVKIQMMKLAMMVSSMVTEKWQ